MVLLTAGWMWPGWHGGLSQWLRMMKMMMPMSVAARAADYAVSGEVGLQGLTRSVYVVFVFLIVRVELRIMVNYRAS